MRLILNSAIALCLLPFAAYAQDVAESDKESKKTLRVLFIGNSYTARHNLASVVEAIAEERDPELDFQPTTVIYGGRRLVDHWRLGTANFVNLHRVTADQVQSTINQLTERLREEPSDKHVKSAIARQRKLLWDLDQPRRRWDVVVLQSYRDDLDGDDSLYHRYAPKFVSLATQQKARVVLYETTPSTQNAEAMTSPPDISPVIAKARSIASLAKSLNASVAPMSMIAHQCQTDRPDLTLRFVNDAHLNQTMAYLTACAIDAAIFDRSPEGIKVDSITDIRYWENKDKSRDRDNLPITRRFNEKDRRDLQQIVAQGIAAFAKLADVE
ncbi:MAG: hypothetical protein AAFU85_14365 [Planctomycetota bacterium]